MAGRSATRSVMVVEDEESNLELMAAVLEDLEVDVVGARSAEEAARLMRRRRPAVVLMDVSLPGQDGLALTRRIRADPATASIPVVALSAHARAEDRQAALDAGCTAWIAKPVDVHLLVRTLARFLE
ncbi:MAG TPA: response regulator [Candidatus Dormibacteraeota bacterium]